MDQLVTAAIGQDGDLTWWQMSIRAVLIFLFGLFLVRISPKRLFGENAAFDILVAVILGSLFSRALTGNAPFLPSMAAAVALCLLHWAFAWTTCRWTWLGRLAKGTKRRLVAAGETDRHAMRRSAIGEEDLMEALRLQGLSDPAQAEAAYLERGGDISAVPRKGAQK